MSSACKVFMIVQENNQNKQGGRTLKTVDYCLQYGNKNVNGVDEFVANFYFW